MTTQKRSKPVKRNPVLIAHLSEDSTISCSKCDGAKHHSQFRSDFRRGHKRRECQECEKAPLISIKRAWVQYKGGKCIHCGIIAVDDTLGMFEFHHLDPSQKEFAVSEKKRNSNFEDIRPELDKCVLLCSNCHALVPSGKIDIFNPNKSHLINHIPTHAFSLLPATTESQSFLKLKTNLWARVNTWLAQPLLKRG